MQGRDADGERAALLGAILRIAGRSPGGWHGSAGLLLDLLNANVPPAGRGVTWPRNPNNLGQMLNLLRPALAEAGIGLRRTKEGNEGRRVIHLAPDAPAEGAAAEGAWQHAGHHAAVLPAAAPAELPGGWQMAAMLAVVAAGLAVAWLFRPLPPTNPSAA